MFSRLYKYVTETLRSPSSSYSKTNVFIDLSVALVNRSGQMFPKDINYFGSDLDLKFEKAIFYTLI